MEALSGGVTGFVSSPAEVLKPLTRCKVSEWPCRWATRSYLINSRLKVARDNQELGINRFISSGALSGGNRLAPRGHINHWRRTGRAEPSGSLRQCPPASVDRNGSQ